MAEDQAPTETVTEAGVRLEVEAVAEGRGPGSRDEGVFYNPAMARNRDASLLATAAALGAGDRFLDGLAATGVRGLRTADALPDVAVTLNDWSEAAARRIRQGAEANGLDEAVTVTSRNLGALLWETRWDWVDVDPFGSPAAFLDAAARSVREEGIVAVTATDTTALHGRHAKPCRRRYGAEPAQTPYGHEIALRILAAALARSGARWDLGLIPVLAFADDHAYRVLSRSTEGAQRGDAALEAIRWVAHCPTCGARTFQDRRAAPCGCDADPVHAGPVWSGPLQDPDLLDGMASAAGDVPLEDPDRVGDLVEALRAEAAAPPLYHDLHEVASRAKVGAAPRQEVLEALRAQGYEATTTHLSPQGVRTDAPADVLAEVVAYLGGS